MIFQVYWKPLKIQGSWKPLIFQGYWKPLIIQGFRVLYLYFSVSENLYISGCWEPLIFQGSWDPLIFQRFWEPFICQGYWESVVFKGSWEPWWCFRVPEIQWYLRVSENHGSILGFSWEHILIIQGFQEPLKGFSWEQFIFQSILKTIYISGVPEKD